MAEITVHTGCMGDTTPICVECFDENGVKHQIRLEVAVLMQDKPRIVQIRYYPNDSDNYEVLIEAANGVKQPHKRIYWND